MSHRSLHLHLDAYLSVREAAQLREQLLTLAARPDETAAEPAPERPMLRVRNRDLVISQLLTPQAFFLPIGVAFVITQFVMEGSWTFIGIASTVIDETEVPVSERIVWSRPFCNVVAFDRGLVPS